MFRPNFVAFLAAVTKSEAGPPTTRCGLRTAPILLATCLDIRELRYSCRLASSIALWLANGACFCCNQPPDSRITRFLMAGHQHCGVARKRRILSLELASRLDKYAILHEASLRRFPAAPSPPPPPQFIPPSHCHHLHNSSTRSLSPSLPALATS